MVHNIRQVLISDPVDPICKDILEQNGLQVTYSQQWTKERLLEEIQVRTTTQTNQFRLHPFLFFLLYFDMIWTKNSSFPYWFLNCFNFKLLVQRFEVLIVRSETKVTEEVLAAAPNLRLVGRGIINELNLYVNSPC